MSLQDMKDMRSNGNPFIHNYNPWWIASHSSCTAEFSQNLGIFWMTSHSQFLNSLLCTLSTNTKGVLASMEMLTGWCMEMFCKGILLWPVDIFLKTIVEVTEVCTHEILNLLTDKRFIKRYLTANNFVSFLSCLFLRWFISEPTSFHLLKF